MKKILCVLMLICSYCFGNTCDNCFDVSHDCEYKQKFNNIKVTLREILDTEKDVFDYYFPNGNPEYNQVKYIMYSSKISTIENIIILIDKIQNTSTN